MSKTKRNNLRYIRMASRKLTQNSQQSYKTETDVRSTVMAHSVYFERLRRIIYYPHRITVTGMHALNKTFYLLCLLATLERVIYSYLNNASELYQHYFVIGLQQADLLISIPTIIIVAMAPICAVVFDRIGKRCFGLIIGFVILIFGNLSFMMGRCAPSTLCYA